MLAGQQIHPPTGISQWSRCTVQVLGSNVMEMSAMRDGVVAFEKLQDAEKFSLQLQEELQCEVRCRQSNVGQRAALLVSVPVPNTPAHGACCRPTWQRLTRMSCFDSWAR